MMQAIDTIDGRFPRSGESPEEIDFFSRNGGLISSLSRLSIGDLAPFVRLGRGAPLLALDAMYFRATDTLIRLHFYPDSEKDHSIITGLNQKEEPHTHSRYFVSSVLTGAIENTFYEPRGSYDKPMIECVRGESGVCSTVTSSYSMPVLDPCEPEVTEQGSFYTVPVGRFHTVRPVSYPLITTLTINPNNQPAEREALIASEKGVEHREPSRHQLDFVVACIAMLNNGASR